ncbi:unnamed protein product, partial [Owenia fusiformis]
ITMLKLLLAIAIIGFVGAEWELDTKWIDPDDIEVTEETIPDDEIEEVFADRMIDRIPSFLIPGPVTIIRGVVDISYGIIQVITSRRGNVNLMQRNGQLIRCPWRQRGGFYRWEWTWTTRMRCAGIPSVRARSKGRNSGVASAGCRTQRLLVGNPRGQITFAYRNRRSRC